MDVILQSVLPFVGILVVLIVVHELGHFVTAKLAGVQVLEFGLGYPPRIVGKRLGETEYTLNWLPLGGFVRLLGEEDPGHPRSLAAKPRWVRLVVLFAGSGMNFVLPVFLFAVAFMVPREVEVGGVVITQVVPGAPAAEAGVRPGDMLLEIEGRKVENVSDAGRFIRLHLGEDVGFLLKRGEELLRLQAHARFAPPDGQGPTGITIAPALSQVTVKVSSVVEGSPAAAAGLQPGDQLLQVDGNPIQSVGQLLAYLETNDTGTAEVVVKREEQVLNLLAPLAPVPPLPEDADEGAVRGYLRARSGFESVAIARPLLTETRSDPFWIAIPKGWQFTIDSLILAKNQVVTWLKGSEAPEVVGPVGIAAVTGEVVEQSGWEVLLEFSAVLSINLAIINILPLPMLDGGRIAFVVLEILRGGRRIAPEKEALVHLIGFALIISFVVVITYFDVLRIVNGETLFR